MFSVALLYVVFLNQNCVFKFLVEGGVLLPEIYCGWWVLQSESDDVVSPGPQGLLSVVFR